MHIGHLVEVRASHLHGRTSMHIAVDVGACDPKGGELVQTTHCIIIFVAVDQAGKPVEVTPWVPETEEDLRLSKYAVKLMEPRPGIEEQMRGHGPNAA